MEPEVVQVPRPAFAFCRFSLTGLLWLALSLRQRAALYTALNLVRFDDDGQPPTLDYSSHTARAFAQRETDGEHTDGSDTREKSD